MTGAVREWSRRVRCIVAMACAGAMLAALSAKAEAPAPGPAPAQDRAGREIHYFSYLKRWPADSTAPGGPSACDSTRSTLEPGRYRAQIVRYAFPAGGSAPESDTERIAFRFGLAVEGAGQGVSLERVADITVESTRETVGHHVGDHAHIPASGGDVRRFSPPMGELLQPLVATRTDADSLPMQVLRILCGMQIPNGSAPDTKIVLWRIDDILRSRNKPSAARLGAIRAFYDPWKKDLGEDVDIDRILEAASAHDVFDLADYVGAYRSDFHRELHAAFREDVRAAAEAWKPDPATDTTRSTTPAAPSPPADSPKPASMERPNPPMAPPVPASSAGWYVIIVVVGALALVVLATVWRFADRLRTIDDRLDELEDSIRRRDQRAPAREHSTLEQHVGRQAEELDDLRARGIQVDERLEAFERRFRSLEYQVAQDRAMVEEEELAIWRDKVDSRLQQLMNAVRALNDALDQKRPPPDAPPRAGRLALAAYGGGGGGGGGGAVAGTRRDAPAVPAPSGERTAAPAASVPPRPGAERPDALADLAQRVGIPLDREQLVKDVGPSPTPEAFYRWIVERYLPERRDAAFYRGVADWFARASQGRAELVLPEPNTAYEKELHEIGGYGAPQYGSLDRIVGLVRPGLRIAGHTVIKPRVVVPS